MDVYLHIGMPKAGSTAIQRRLTGLRGWLAARGQIYPGGLHTAHNHSFLVAAGSPERRLPRHYRRRYGARTDEAQADADAWIGSEIAAARTAGAGQLILSAETLFRMATGARVRAVAELLRPALRAPAGGQEGRLIVLAWLRRPSEFYVSAVQQRLKAAHHILPPGPVEYRAALQAWGAVADEIRVRRYDRDLFPGRDIARAFYAEIGGDPDALPPAPDSDPASDPGARDPGARDPATRDPNASISAEGMALLQAYRASFHSEARDQHRKDSNLLLKVIAAAEAEPWPEGIAPTRPRLLPDWADYIDHASSDLIWLREAHGLVFPGIEYGRIAPHPAAAHAPATPTQVAEICPLDPAAREHLALRVIARLARRVTRDEKQARRETGRETRRKTRGAAPGGVPPA